MLRHIHLQLIPLSEAGCALLLLSWLGKPHNGVALSPGTRPVVAPPTADQTQVSQASLQTPALLVRSRVDFFLLNLKKRGANACMNPHAYAGCRDAGSGGSSQVCECFNCPQELLSVELALAVQPAFQRKPSTCDHWCSACELFSSSPPPALLQHSPIPLCLFYTTNFQPKLTEGELQICLNPDKPCKSKQLDGASLPGCAAGEAAACAQPLY